MAYITLDELKKILPNILDSWIDEDDESWEWIFQEIEQKCHIGKKGKKKDKKPKKKDMQNAMEIAIMAHRNDINELTKRIDMLSNKLSNLSASHINFESKVNGKVIDINTEIENMHRKQIDMQGCINNIRLDISQAKSMAEVAKNRTQVDYSKYKQPISYGLWSDCKRVIKTCERYGATKEELEQLDLIMSKYIRNPAEKRCMTCKYYTDREAGHGMHNSELDCYSIVGSCANYSKWEAKDNG